MTSWSRCSPGACSRDYDERQHGPLDLRFKRAVANAIRNMVEKQRNARRLLAHRFHRPGEGRRFA